MTGNGIRNALPRPLARGDVAGLVPRPLRLSRDPAPSPGACAATLAEDIAKLMTAVERLTERLEKVVGPADRLIGEAPDTCTIRAVVSPAPQLLLPPKWAAHHLAIHRRTVLRRAQAAGAAHRVGGRWLIDVRRIERPRYARRAF